MIAGLTMTVLPLALSAAAVHSAGCSLSSVVLGGTAVVQVDGWGMKRSADYVIRWSEPLITQTQYWWSTSKGTLQQTVLNNQGPGTYQASLYYLGRQGEFWEASCLLEVN
jgi:hypothetical protein